MVSTQVTLNKLRLWLKNLPFFSQTEQAPAPVYWPDLLQEVDADLKLVTKSSEGEFLAIGEKLQHFYQRADGIAKISQSVARSISGDQTAKVIKDFQAIVRRMRAMEAESDQSSQTMQELLDILGTLRQQLAAFQNIVRSLRMLCISIRIQSARIELEEFGFDSLADDVGTLAEEVENRCERLLQRAEALAQILGDAVARARTLETQQKAQVQTILSDTSKSLKGITEKHRRSAKGAETLATRYAGIGQSIGNIVMSLQIHDLTRQRVEHAQEALEKITAKLKPNTSKDAGDASTTQTGRPQPQAPVDETLLAQAGAISELQIAQVQHARDELVAAVETIMANLQGVGDLVAEIVQETQALNGAADTSDHDSLAELEAGFASIVQALSSYNAANQELAAVTSSVGATLQQMAVFSSDIEAIGIKIKLIALNAIIKSAHFGDKGATLSVLAEAIHDLSVDTCARTETVHQNIDVIMNSSKALGSADKLENTTIPAISQSLQALMDTLKSMNSEIATQLAQMLTEGDGLSRQIATTIAGITVHQQVSKAIQQAVKGLERIVVLARDNCPGFSESDRSALIQELESAYTMQGERAVHRSVAKTGAAVAGGALAGAAATAVATPEPDEDILFFDDPVAPDTAAAGDVELFDDSGGDIELFDDSGGDIELFDDPAPAEQPGEQAASPAAPAAEIWDDNIELFGDDPAPAEQSASPAAPAAEVWDDNIELFGDDPAPAASNIADLDGDVVLFDDPLPADGSAPPQKDNSADEDLGDNVELF